MALAVPIEMWYTIGMNSEMKAERLEEIKKLEGLLAYAVQHNYELEAERISDELKRIVKGL